MKKTPSPQSDPTTLAVLHRTGKTWRGIIASVKNAKPAILVSRDFPPDRAGRIEDWLSEHQVGSVLCVLPSAAIICRNVTLPDASPAQLEQALRLQAEAHLLAIAPAHRVGIAVLPNAPGETSRTGLILAWPESATLDLPPTDRPVHFVPDVACLAAILNGQRPSDMVLWLDRSDGSMALAITHAGGAMFRATREDATNTETWQRGVGRVVAESALSVGHTGAFIDTMMRTAQARSAALPMNESALMLPPELINTAAARIDGASNDEQWWSRFGVAAGALLARTGPLASLTRYLHTPPVERPSRVRALASAMSRPRAAVVLALTCIGLLMLGPLAIAAMRYGILSVRFGDTQNQLAVATSVKKELAMYTALQSQNAWPMTKLLADVTANAPVGIELEMIRFEGGKDFAVSGSATGQGGKSATELVASFEDNLRKDGLFDNIRIQWTNTGAMGPYKFDLSGDVAKPYDDPRYGEDRDFAKKTYQVRLYGEAPAHVTGARSSRSSSEPSDDDASASPTVSKTAQTTRQAQPTTNPEQPPDDDAMASAPTGRRRPTTGGGPDLAPMPGAEMNDGDLPPSMEVPQALSEEQINKMEMGELREALQKVASARKHLPTNHEAQERLKKEWDLLYARLRQVR